MAYELLFIKGEMPPGLLFIKGEMPPGLLLLNTIAQIILWVEMLKFSKDVFFKEQNFVKETRESFGTFKFSTWNLQIK